jgi:hypothetical protein
MAFAKEFAYSEKATAELGIPFLIKSAVEVSLRNCTHVSQMQSFDWLQLLVA